MIIFKSVVFTTFIYFSFINSFSQSSITENLKVVSSEKGIQKTEDELFLNKGIWGVHYLKNYANLTHFFINNKAVENSNEFYEIERWPNISGQVKGNVNLFRHLLPKNKTVNVTNFNTIQFYAINNQPLEIILMPENLSNWNNRLRYTIPANSIETFYNIPFNDFTDSIGNGQSISNIKTIVFSVIGDYKNYIPYTIQIKKLVLGKNDRAAYEILKLINYPNPFKNKTTIKLPKAASHVDILVYDLLGRTVHIQHIKATNNKVEYYAPNLSKGIYKYTLKDSNHNNYTGTFAID